MMLTVGGASRVFFARSVGLSTIFHVILLLCHYEELQTCTFMVMKLCSGNDYSLNLMYRKLP